MSDKIIINKSAAIDEEIEIPGVITYRTLIKLMVKNAPNGERAQFYREENIKLDEAENIRIEFLGIKKIDLLWAMPNLLKLSLAHNNIGKIENLDELINLKELDLSFNHINVMENLNHLVKLEILILTGNQIAEIEGIDKLKNLTIFSIANNDIKTLNHVVYLRSLNKLRSVNIADNPCTNADDYNDYFVAFLPQITYFTYVLIDDVQRTKALEKYGREVAKIEKEEMKEKINLDKQGEVKLKESGDFDAFVENMDGEIFFDMILLQDKNASLFTAMNESAKLAFENHKKNFTNICREIYEFGLKMHKQRADEIKEFKTVIHNGQNDVRDKSRGIIDQILMKRNEIVVGFRKPTTSEEAKNSRINVEKDTLIDKSIIRSQELVDEFNEFLSRMWTILLEDQVNLHDQFEDIVEVFRNNLTDMKDILLNFIRDAFIRMRESIPTYRDDMNKIYTLYIIDIANESLSSENTLDSFQDSDNFNNALMTFCDIQLQNIDAREDTMISRTNNWLEDLINQFITDENVLYRQKIFEISHFLQFQRDQIYNDLLAINNFAADVMEATAMND